MKSEQELKSRQVPTRMTQDQYKEIKQKADDRNQSVSAYVVEAAVHGDEHLTPLQRMQIHNLFLEAADALEATNPELASKLRKGGDEVWQ